MKTPALILALGLALICTGFAVDPPPDGGYPNANTAEGEDALFNLTTGTNNTAIGFNALFTTTTSSHNTAVGFNALFSATTGNFNTAVGDSALSADIFGGGNVAVGASTLESNTNGNNNTAIGFIAMSRNTTGEGNIAVGASAMGFNTTGIFNVAMGEGALGDNTNGQLNTAIGHEALSRNTSGNGNVAVGMLALYKNKGGDNNIGIGDLAGTNVKRGDNNIYIGDVGGTEDESGQIRIGAVGTHTGAFIAGISGVTVASGVPVIVDTNGQLGTVTSSARYKNSIKPMAQSSEAILSLKPVTFRYKHELDPNGTPQFGLVAEQVEKVDPNLVARDDHGKPYSVRYEAVNAMLLNEFLKEHKKVEKLEKQLQQMAARLDARGL